MRKCASIISLVLILTFAWGCKDNRPKEVDITPPKTANTVPNQNFAHSQNNGTAQVMIEPVVLYIATAPNPFYTASSTVAVWSLASGTFTWSDALARCQSYGAGWSLPGRSDFTAFTSFDFTSQSFLIGMDQLRVWTNDQDASGNHCAMKVTEQEACSDPHGSAGWSTATSDLFSLVCLKPQ